MSSYRGRFAPSPTGPLHLGSLLTAVASFLDARAHAGTWLVRIEDIDPPREQPGASDEILATLRAHALRWDEEVLFQSTRITAHTTAIDQLLHDGHAFRCTCSRAELARARGLHAAHCPITGARPDRPAAVRVHDRDLPGAGTDLLLGTVSWPAPEPEGSFVVGRRDGLIAYHLAVVVDDAWQRISHVVRGRDLLDSTPYHLLLQRLLGLESPVYGHLPLVLGTDGQKLSKQNLAPAVRDDLAPHNLLSCLRALGQPEPPSGSHDDCAELLKWAAQHWDRTRVPRNDILPG
jgi:glutamyl-Q tRNA(Asp) synthetase